MVSLGKKGIINGSIFQNEVGDLLPIESIDVVCHEVLEEVRNRKNKLIRKDVVIEEYYSIYRSLRWGYITQASDKGVLELDTTTANIWRNTYITVRRRETTNMVEHYSQI